MVISRAKTPVRHGKSKHGAKAKSQRDVEEKNDDEQRALGERGEGEDADDEIPPPLEQQRPANHPTTEVAAGNPAPTAVETGHDVGEAEEPEQAEASTSGNAADLPASAASAATLTTAVQQLAMMVAELRAANRASSSTYEGVITVGDQHQPVVTRHSGEREETSDQPHVPDREENLSPQRTAAIQQQHQRDEHDDRGDDDERDYYGDDDDRYGHGDDNDRGDHGRGAREEHGGRRSNERQVDSRYHAASERRSREGRGSRAHGGSSRRSRRGRQAGRRASRRRPRDGSSPSSSSDDNPNDEPRHHDDWYRRRRNVSSGGSSLSSSSSSSSESEGGRGPRQRRQHEHEQRERGHERFLKKKNVKDLELPTFTPSPKVSVSTWIDRVDLALRGAAESGRGKWTDKAIYFILGNKLMENAAKWWVDMDRRLSDRKRTWTYLKKALLRRYGEKLDKSAAELRVCMRRMMPGETHADFAAGLRDVFGRNKVSERVLLAQFYRCLDKTTKKLVKQDPAPRTLEKAVDKAIAIDDPMDNVAQGMINIGQPWATAPSLYVIHMNGTLGQTNVIPGISGTGLSADLACHTDGTAVTQPEVRQIALFTNPQGIYNKLSGTWDPPPGHAWNGRYWYEPKKATRKPAATSPTSSRAETKKPALKLRSKREATGTADSDGDLPQKRLKAAVKQTGAVNENPSATGRRLVRNQRADSGGTGASGPAGNSRRYHCGQSGHWTPQ